jgi:hypothetical protein
MDTEIKMRIRPPGTSLDIFINGNDVFNLYLLSVIQRTVFQSLHGQGHTAAT